MMYYKSNQNNKSLFDQLHIYSRYHLFDVYLYAYIICIFLRMNTIHNLLV